MRERALKVVMVLVGLGFCAIVYPLVTALWQGNHDAEGDLMMGSIYVTLGVFLLLAVRNPSAHRSLIAFAAWSSFAHGAVMTVLGYQVPSQRMGFFVASAVLAVIGVALIALGPAKGSGVTMGGGLSKARNAA